MFYISNKDEFKVFVQNTFKDFNFNNISHFDEFYEFYKRNNTFPNNKAKSIGVCKKFFMQFRKSPACSQITVDYWKSMGYFDENEIKNKISCLQKQRSNISVDYWINNGYTIDDAKEKIKSIQQKNLTKKYSKYTKEELKNQSVWSKDYWINKGYSNEQAEYEVHKRNYGCREFWSSDEEYNNIKKIIADKTSYIIKHNPELYKDFLNPSSISKEEIEFFNNFDDNIHHKQFIINVLKNSRIENTIIKYDGYTKTENGIILIEYDGLYWHNQSYDDIKDEVAFEERKDILGVIRVSDEFYKKNKNSIKIIVQNGIEEIKSGKCRKIKFY